MPSREPRFKFHLFTVAPASVAGPLVQVPRSTESPSASRPPAGGAASASTRGHCPARVSGSPGPVSVSGPGPSGQVPRTTESPSASIHSRSQPGPGLRSRFKFQDLHGRAPIRVAFAFSPCRRRPSESPSQNASVPCHRSKSQIQVSSSGFNVFNHDHPSHRLPRSARGAPEGGPKQGSCQESWEPQSKIDHRSSIFAHRAPIFAKPDALPMIFRIGSRKTSKRALQ